MLGFDKRNRGKEMGLAAFKKRHTVIDAAVQAHTSLIPEIAFIVAEYIIQITPQIKPQA